jgi:predicted transcriptional regulator
MVEESDMKTLQVGIMSREAFQERTLKIARGEYKPKKNEPKIWFSSMKSLCEVLSENNMRLLRTIHEKNPESIKELSELTNREQSNLSRTLKTMARYGIIELKKIGKKSIPIAKALDFNISCSAI